MKDVIPIRGTYRGSTKVLCTKVLHYFDNKTGLNVMTDRKGYLIGGWKLSKDHIKHLISNGNAQ